MEKRRRGTTDVVCRHIHPQMPCQRARPLTASVPPASLRAISLLSLGHESRQSLNRCAGLPDERPRRYAQRCATTGGGEHCRRPPAPNVSAKYAGATAIQVLRDRAARDIMLRVAHGRGQTLLTLER